MYIIELSNGQPSTKRNLPLKVEYHKPEIVFENTFTYTIVNKKAIK